MMCQFTFITGKKKKVPFWRVMLIIEAMHLWGTWEIYLPFNSVTKPKTPLKKQS